MTGFNGERERPDLVTGGRRARLGGSRRHPRRRAWRPRACGSAARALVVPGGQDPDWGPAAAPSVSAPPAPSRRRFVSVRAANRRLRLAREPQGAADPHRPCALLRSVLTDRDADRAQARPDREGERNGHADAPAAGRRGAADRARSACGRDAHRERGERPRGPARSVDPVVGNRFCVTQSRLAAGRQVLRRPTSATPSRRRRAGSPHGR